MSSPVLDKALCFFPLKDNIDKIIPNILPIKTNIIPDKPLIIDHVARVYFRYLPLILIYIVRLNYK